MRYATIAACLLMWLWSFGSALASPKEPDLAARAKEDDLLMKDSSRAGSELEGRLLASIRVEDGILIVSDPAMGHVFSSYLPVSAPWVLHCGVGMRVVFGASVTGDSDGTRNDVEVTLTHSFVDQKTCAIVGLRVAKRLKTMVQDSAR